MDLRLLTTSWRRSLGAMFWNGQGDTGLVFLYPFAAPRLFHTFFCPPLRLTVLSEEGEVIFDQVTPPWRFVRLPPTRLILEVDQAAWAPLEDLRACSGRHCVFGSRQPLFHKKLRAGTADFRRQRKPVSPFLG